MLQSLSDFISKVTRGEKIRIDGVEAQWKKVSELTPGTMIAVPAADVVRRWQSEDKTNSAADVLWDEIVSIRRLPPEKVYDIEVEGTHNFVAGHLVETPLPKTDRIITDEPVRGPPQKNKLEIGNWKLEIPRKWYGGFFAHNTYTTGSLITNQTLSVGGDSTASASIYSEGASGNFYTWFGGFGKYQNYLTYSEAFDNAAWTKSANTTVTGGDATAPDSTTTADKITFAANAATDEIYQSTGQAAASTTYTASVWLKYTSSQTVRLGLRGTGATPESTTLTANVTTTWQRFSVTKTFSAAATGNAEMFIDDAGSSSAVNTHSWGAQVEAASTMGVYAPVSGLAASTTGRGLIAGGAGPHRLSFGGAGIPIISIGDTANTSKVSLRLSGGSVSNQLELQTTSGIINIGDNSVNHRLDVYNSGNTAAVSMDANSANVSYINAGNVAIGQTTVTTGYKMEINGDLKVGDGSGTDILVGAGAGKIDVGTVDPPYTINGDKFATYMASMTGMKEETTGKVELPVASCQLSVCKYTIDFNTVEKGSDLWLFSKTTSLTQNIDKMIVLLTPADNVKTWYKIDKERFTLTIYSSRPAEIAYRLTAPRFDSSKWGNTRDSDHAGLVIEDAGQPPQTAIGTSGNLAPEYVPKLSDFNITADTSGKYNLADQTNQIINDLGLYSDAAIANLKTGVISAQQAIISNLSILGDLKTDGKIVSPVVETEKLVTKDIEATGTAKFGQLLVQNNATFSGEVQSSQLTVHGDATVSGVLTTNELTTNQLTNSGDATISGTLYADNIRSRDLDNLRSSFGNLLDRVNGLATPSSSTPSSIIYNPSSISPTETPTPTLTPTPTETPTPTLTPTPTVILGIRQLTETPGSTDSGQARMTSADNSDATDSASLLDRLSNFLTSTNSINDRIEEFLATSSAMIAETSGTSPASDAHLSDTLQFDQFDQLAKLTVIGPASLADTTISGSLMVDGGILIENTKVASLNDTLYLSSLNNIDLMGGKMIVDKNGNLAIEGVLIAKGGIVTNDIRSDNGNLTIDLTSQAQPQGLTDKTPGVSFGKLLVLGNTEITNNLRIGDSLEVAGSASVSGLARFNEVTAATLTADKLNLSNLTNSANSTNSSYLLTAADNFLQNGINAPGLRTTASAGEAVLLAGYQELVIFNPNITDNTLIYITPTSPTQNRTLFVADKKPGSYFVVALDSPIPYDVKFNWWVVN